MGVDRVLVREFAEGPSGDFEVFEVPTPEVSIPGLALLRKWGQEPIFRPSRFGKVADVRQDLKRVGRRLVFGLETENPSPASPGGQRSLTLEVVPTFMDQRQDRFIKSRIGHRKIVAFRTSSLQSTKIVLDCAMKTDRLTMPILRARSR
jgi:hypothetical protein